MAGNQIGSMTNFPQGFANGLSVRGMPLIQMQPGQVFFVNNSPVLNANQKAGSNGNRGTYLDPLATVQYALTNMCVQGRGDIIFVGPGHKENISDATTLAMNCAGVAIIGLGAGTSRPMFTLDTANTANIPVRSSDMSIQNCLFLNNFADIASVFTGIRFSSATSTIGLAGSAGATAGTTLNVVGAVTGSVYPGMSVMGTGVKTGTIILRQLTGTANGIGTYEVNVSQAVTSATITGGTHNFCVDNCEFRDLSSVLNALTIVTTSATTNSASGLTFTRNRISSLGTTAATTAIVLGAANDRLQVNDNFGNWAVLNDTAAMIAAGAFNQTNFEFARNIINRPNTSTSSGLAISCSGTAWTGQCYDNRIWGLNNSAQIWINTGTKLAFNQNFCPITAVADKSGLINPAAV